MILQGAYIIRRPFENSPISKKSTVSVKKLNGGDQDFCSFPRVNHFFPLHIDIIFSENSTNMRNLSTLIIVGAAFVGIIHGAFAPIIDVGYAQYRGNNEEKWDLDVYKG